MCSVLNTLKTSKKVGGRIKVVVSSVMIDIGIQIFLATASTAVATTRAPTTHEIPFAVMDGDGALMTLFWYLIDLNDTSGS